MTGLAQIVGNAYGRVTNTASPTILDPNKVAKHDAERAIRDFYQGRENLDALLREHFQGIIDGLMPGVRARPYEQTMASFPDVLVQDAPLTHDLRFRQIPTGNVLQAAPVLNAVYADEVIIPNQEFLQRENYIPQQNGFGKGFTLIELLTVVSIISVLAAIIFPVYSHIKENAKKTKSMSNLKQIGQALFLYSMDYSYYPWSEDPSNPGEPVYKLDSPALVYFANEYMKEKTMFLNPFDFNSRIDQITTAERGLDNSARASYEYLGCIKYKFNSSCNVFVPYSFTNPFGNIVVIPNFSSKFLDTNGNEVGVSQIPLMWDLYGGIGPHNINTTPLSQQNMANYLRKGGGGHVLYLDGHVEWLKAIEWESRNIPVVLNP